MTYSLAESTTGIAALGRGIIPWSEVELGEVTVDQDCGEPEIDAAVHLVALASPSASDTTEELPSSVTEVCVGDDYYIEVWASDVGSVNTGLTSVYVDMLDDPCAASTVQFIDHGGLFSTFSSGTIEAWGIDELGGSSLAGEGI